MWFLKSRFISIALTCLGLLSLEPSARSETLRVYLDWFPNAEFAGMFAAMDNGWYKEAGIDLVPVFHGLDIIPSVLNGEADIGMDSAHDLIKHAASGTEIKAFAAKYQLNPNSIVVGQDSGINKLTDLRGKTLGIFSPQERGMYAVMLGSAGLTLGDVKFKKIKTFREKEIVELMRKKEIDAIIAWEFNWTVTFALLGYPVKVFPGYENGFYFYGIVYFARSAYIREHRDLLKRFLEVTFRGWREVYQNPEYYAQKVVEERYLKERYIEGSKTLTLKQQRLEIKLRKRYFFEGVGPNGIGLMSEHRWVKSLEIAKKYGLITADHPIRPRDLFDLSVLNSLDRRTP